MTNLKEWLERRAREDERLYEQYGKPLEKDHKGEFLAIGSGGGTILGRHDVDVLQKAIATFGRGNFALVRVGYSALGQWLSLDRQ